MISISKPAFKKIRRMIRAREVVKQAHVRFDPEIVVMVPFEAAMGALVRGSVKASTNKQYDSRLRTLAKFLCTVRNVEEVETKSCSKLEYVNFLHNWKLQKMGPANGTSAALLQQHRMEGIQPSFLEDMDMKKAIKGAGTSCKKVDKGLMNPYMISEFISFLGECDHADLGGPCRWCKDDHYIRERLQLAVRAMVELPVRPGNLKDMQMTDASAPNGVPLLYVDALKTAPNGGQELATWEGLKILIEAQGLSSNAFLFPKCAQAHLASALRKAEQWFVWPEGLVYAPHCLRHACMTEKASLIAQAVTKVVAGISAPTFKRVYTKPLAKRSRAIRDQGRREE